MIASALLIAASVIVGPAPSASADAEPASAEAPAPENRRRVLVLPVRLHGVAASPNVAQFDVQLRAGLGHGDIELIEAPRECADEDDACVLELAAELGVDYVVAVEVAVAARDFNIEFRSFRAGDPESSSPTLVECPICGTAEVAERIAARSRLIRDWILTDSELAHVALAGQPRGASVLIDGEPVGALPFDGTVEPGPHVIRVSAPGMSGARTTSTNRANST